MKIPILNHVLICDRPQHGLSKAQLEHLLNLPEKVVQFGTGVLLRGLPDYYIDRANKAGIFNGRIVVVKTTRQGDAEDFTKQDNLYTHVINGLREGEPVKETLINCSISRVLAAQEQWKEVLQCAADPGIELIISNTTERGLVYVEESLSDVVPGSFPGKLLAFLHHRFKELGGSPGTGLTIVPTELVEGNGRLLRGYVLRGASFNHLGKAFEDWVISANIFCDSLVDRIVPGKPVPEKAAAYFDEWGYQDALLFESEPYDLWAIAGESEKIPALSFAACNPGIRIEPDITRYKELKLRLLNGTHILSCGKAILEGIRTVREGFADPVFCGWAEALMGEIRASIPVAIEKAELEAYSESVLLRFKNPFIEHQWESILLNYSSKLKIRALPLLRTYYQRYGTIPGHIAEGFAAYLALSVPDKMENGEYFKWVSEQWIRLQDELAPLLFHQYQQKGFAETANEHLRNAEFWGFPLDSIPGFIENVMELALTRYPIREIAK
jgi:tagaturonate reductase